MPLYDRKCRSCDELFEVMCKISEKDNVQECPSCGSIDGTWMVGTAPRLIEPERLGRLKRGDTREVLSKIHGRNATSTLRDRNTF